MNPIDELRQRAAQTANVPDPWKLRCLRELRSLTQAQVAEQVGYAPSHGRATINRIERGTIPFGRDVARRIEQALDCAPGSLLSTPAEALQNHKASKRFDALGRGASLASFLLNEIEQIG